MEAVAPDPVTPEPEYAVPREPLGRLFLRFLKFGSLAWGGPVAQIGMIQQELVDEERWISPERFRRALAVYQVLPGPEAHELCVYFGMLSRGRWGGLVAGLGFMLPGFVLMFALSWLYLRYGLDAPLVRAAFGTIQAAVVALVVRAVVRIGSHALPDRWAFAIAGIAAGAQLAGVHFALSLAAGAVLYPLAQRGRQGLAAGLALAFGKALKRFLEGITAAVVGLIAATALGLLATSLRGPLAALVFGGSLMALFRWKSKMIVPLLIGAAAVIGLLSGGG